MKNVLSIIVTIIFFSLNISSIFAMDLGTPSGGLKGRETLKDLTNLQKRASRGAEVQGRRLSEVIKKSDTLITNRIDSLNKLSTRLQNDNKLTADEKTNLLGQIQTAITGLTALKTKIDADTDVQIALTDGKQIFTNFRIYEIFEPKMRLLIMLNNLQTTTSRIHALIPQLQKLITDLQSQGKDVVQLTTLTSDINTQIQTINTLISQDLGTVQAVNPESIDAQVSLQQIRKELQTTVPSTFGKIKSDIAQMRPLFKELNLSGLKTSTPTTSTPSATPATTTAQ